ncbi:hypothetical protein N7526_001906 [Penicillium atrosanguineum]|nr:hypothetical protein N7526_001906 [Penicillium atrosanguineum]
MTTSSPNFGPLTTTFTPPPDCFQEQLVQHNTNSTLLQWGPTCDSGKVGFAASCYPSGWSGEKSNDTNLKYKGFSPGLICPSGFTATFSGSHIKEFKSFLLSEGYGFDGDLCTSNTLTLSSRPLITNSNSQCSTKTVSNYNGVLGKHGRTGDATFQAMPVILIRNTISDSIPIATASSPVDSSSSGIATGAKIAIGICVPVGLIIISAIAFIWWHRHSRAKLMEAGTSFQSQAHTQPSLVGSIMEKPELDGRAAVNPSGKQELDAQTESGPRKPPVELPAQQCPVTPQAELPGDTGDFVLHQRM